MAGITIGAGRRLALILGTNDLFDEALKVTASNFCAQDQDKRAKDEAHRREIDRSFREEHEVRLRA